MKKTLENTNTETAKENVEDIEIFGNPDSWVLICKASSKSEGWMKSTKAHEIPGRGCLVQVTTQQGDNIAESLTFVPMVGIMGNREHGGHMLVMIDEKHKW